MTSSTPTRPATETAGGESTAGGAPTTRVCGRCRQAFPADPTLPDAQATDWWACAPCRTALFGDAPVTT